VIYRHEYDQNGNHRLVIVLGDQTLATGEWTSYSQPAYAQVEAAHYFIVTDCLSGYLEANTAYHFAPRATAKTFEVTR
jgi:hypothetical protein